MWLYFSNKVKVSDIFVAIIVGRKGRLIFSLPQLANLFDVYGESCTYLQ